MEKEILYATTIGSFALAVGTTLTNQGLDADTIFRDAGLDLESFNDPDSRVSIAKMAAVWKAAVAQTDNSAFAIEVVKSMPIGILNALGMAMMVSENLEMALHKYVRYNTMITEGFDVSLQAQGPYMQVTVINKLPERAQEALDCALAVIVKFCRDFYAEDFNPVRVALSRRKPKDAEKFSAYFGCDVEFEAAIDSVTLPQEIIRKPLQWSNPEMAQHMDHLVHRYVTKYKKEGILSQVYEVLLELLPTGDFSEEKVAQRLNRSVRHLQRQLKREDTSYRVILNDVRKNMAEQYVKDKNFSLTEIAYLLGFSEASSFSRAFKKWMGESPGDYRAAQTTK